MSCKRLSFREEALNEENRADGGVVVARMLESVGPVGFDDDEHAAPLAGAGM